jgi:hypothetical protein
VWNETDRYEGSYEDDRPHGFGTANLAGEVFSGQWKRGCLKSGEKIVAIGGFGERLSLGPAAATD